MEDFLSVMSLKLEIIFFSYNYFVASVSEYSPLVFSIVRTYNEWAVHWSQGMYPPVHIYINNISKIMEILCIKLNKNSVYFIAKWIPKEHQIMLHTVMTALLL